MYLSTGFPTVQDDDWRTYPRLVVPLVHPVALLERVCIRFVKMVQWLFKPLRFELWESQLLAGPKFPIVVLRLSVAILDRYNLA